MADRIEKHVLLRAPIERVWQAISDHREFGSWFKVKIDAPFKTGQASTGHITYPGYEYVKWTVRIDQIKAPQLFSFYWHPHAIDPKMDYTKETPTLVEFHLERHGEGTLLRVIESGFENIPDSRREQAFMGNARGWEEQMHNITDHLSNDAIE